MWGGHSGASQENEGAASHAAVVAAAAAALAENADDEMEEVHFDADAEGDSDVENLAFGGAVELPSLRPGVLGRRSDAEDEFLEQGSSPSDESQTQFPRHSQQLPVSGAGGVQWLRNLFRLRRQNETQAPRHIPRVARRRTRYAPVGGELLQVEGGGAGLERTDQQNSQWLETPRPSSSIPTPIDIPQEEDSRESVSPPEGEDLPSQSSLNAGNNINSAEPSPSVPSNSSSTRSSFSRALERMQAALRRQSAPAVSESASVAPDARTLSAPVSSESTSADGTAAGSRSENLFSRVWRLTRERVEEHRARAAAAALARRESELQETEEFGPDDPTCQQLLLVGGVVCWSPLLWLLGALLFIATPRTHVRARKWGLANVTMILIVVALVILRAREEPLHRPPQVWIYEAPRHITLPPWIKPAVSPGEMWNLQEDKVSPVKLIEVSFSEETMPSWAWLNVNDASFQAATGTDRSSIEIRRVRLSELMGLGAEGLALDPSSLSVKDNADHRFRVASAIEVAAVALSGRIQFGGVFVVSRKQTTEGSSRNPSSPDFSSKPFAFPEDTHTTEFLDSDAGLPLGYSGAGLRCLPVDELAEPEKHAVDHLDRKLDESKRERSAEGAPPAFKWLLLSPEGAGEGSSRNGWSTILDSTVVAFGQKHVCSMAVVLTQQTKSHAANAPRQSINYVHSLFLKALP